MMEIGDVVRDIFRALGIPEWEVIGMPVPLDVDGSKVNPPASGLPKDAAGPVPACPGGAEARGKARKRARKALPVAE